MTTKKHIRLTQIQFSANESGPWSEARIGLVTQEPARGWSPAQSTNGTYRDDNHPERFFRSRIIELELPSDTEARSPSTVLRRRERAAVAEWFVNRAWAHDAGGRISRGDIEELLDELLFVREDQRLAEAATFTLMLCRRCAGDPNHVASVPLAPSDTPCMRCGTVTEVFRFWPPVL